MESALVFPLVMLLILGILEGGLIFRTYLSATNAASSASRMGSIEGDVTYADYDILHAVASGASGASMSQIGEVIIYNAAAPGAGPTDECITNAMTDNDIGINGVCNVYNNADFDRPKTDFGLAGFGADQYWAPATRRISLSNGSDYLGIWVHMKCQCLSNAIFGIAPDLHATTVIQMEPSER